MFRVSSNFKKVLFVNTKHHNRCANKKVAVENVESRKKEEKKTPPPTTPSLAVLPDLKKAFCQGISPEERERHERGRYLVGAHAFLETATHITRATVGF